MSVSSEADKARHAKIVNACNKSNFTLVKKGKPHIVNGEKLRGKFTLERGSELVLYADESDFFINGEGTVYCYAKSVHLYVNRHDKHYISMDYKKFEPRIEYVDLPAFQVNSAMGKRDANEASRRPEAPATGDNDQPTSNSPSPIRHIELKVRDCWNSLVMCSLGFGKLERCRFLVNVSEPRRTSNHRQTNETCFPATIRSELPVT